MAFGSYYANRPYPKIKRRSTSLLLKVVYHGKDGRVGTLVFLPGSHYVWCFCCFCLSNYSAWYTTYVSPPTVEVATTVNQR